jgi:NAD(P)-dependent dehydrogenase (short-subunit alcohol dehydrogenase family)
MSSKTKVAVITGASQGMGAALVEAYRGLDYGVVATARSTGQATMTKFWWSPAILLTGRRPSM